MAVTSMTVEFQGQKFPVHDTVTPERPNTQMLKVSYLNKTRNITGSVQALETPRLLRLLQVQARCCATGDAEDVLVPCG